MGFIRPTPEELKKDEITSLVRDILGSEYISLDVNSLDFKEDRAGPTSARISISSSNKKTKRHLTGVGVGIVDAMFQAFKDHFLKKYNSLMGIGLSSFTVVADNYSSQTPEGTDALVKVRICFRDTRGKIVPFTGTSRSLSMAAASSLVNAFEYYINSEVCFIKLRSLVKDAESRSRGDLRESYVSQLVRIVGVSSYEEVSV